MSRVPIYLIRYPTYPKKIANPKNNRGNRGRANIAWCFLVKFLCLRETAKEAIRQIGQITIATRSKKLIKRSKSLKASIGFSSRFRSKSNLGMEISAYKNENNIGSELIEYMNFISELDNSEGPCWLIGLFNWFFADTTQIIPLVVIGGYRHYSLQGWCWG